MNNSQLILTIVLTIFFLSLSPFSAKSMENNAIKSFDIRPSVCVIERRKNCEYQFVFRWELNFPTRVCLSAKDSNEMIACGSELTKEVEVNVNIESSTEYNLTSIDNPMHKLTRSIDVQRLGVDSRVLHRRIWSVF